MPKSLCSSNTNVGIAKCSGLVPLTFSVRCSLSCFSLADNFVDTLCHILDISRVEASHGNSAIASHVNMTLLDHFFDLWLVQTCVCEHTNLVCDVVPSSRGSFLFNGSAQCRAHRHDSVGHELQLTQPLLLELF